MLLDKSYLSFTDSKFILYLMIAHLKTFSSAANSSMIFGPNNTGIQPGIFFFDIKMDIIIYGRKIIYILIMEATKELTKTQYSYSLRGVKLLVSCIRLQKDRSFY